MNFKRLIRTAAATVALCGITLTPAIAADTITIGAIMGLTGPGATFGVPGKVAGEILAEEVNAKGGLEVGGKKYQIKIIGYDDQFKAAEAVAAYNRLLNQDGVKYLLVGTSAPAMAIKKSLEEDKVIGLTSAFSPAVIDDNTKFMFRLYSTSANYMPGYVKWIKDNVKGKKIALMNPNDESGWGHIKNVEPVLKDAGFEVAGSELYERNTKDFSPVLTKILALQPSAIDVGVTQPATAGLIIRQARDLGFKGAFVQTGGGSWQQTVDVAGKEAAEGLVNIQYADPDNPEFKRIAERYTKIVGQPPSEILASYYDAYKLLLAAIQKAGDPNDTTKIAATFPQILPTKSIQGDEITYGKHQFVTTMYVVVVQNGRAVVKGKVR